EDAAPAASAAPAEEPAPAEDAAPPEAESYTIGICQLVQHDALDAATQGCKDALTERLGDAVTFDEQNAAGDPATCSTIVTGFVSNNYDLIMANATPALQAAVSATTEIPILGTSVTDYGTALADENLDPAAGTGINVSGTSDGVNAQLYADLTMELVPEAKKVSILYCNAEANSVLQSANFIEAMKTYNVECTEYTFSDSNDLQSVVTAAIADCDAMYIPTDNTAASNMTIVNNVCAPAGIPIICGEENMCANGGLATVSISYYDIGYLCGEQAYEILVNGADVSTLPIGYSANPVKEYNAEYAAAINFEIPEGFVAIGE
ncbi:MAG: ABC transporter substrate-binding protein, partial [Oscillospiraceae bacterium]|nr:ABC transporter substrate-binding protein [Oscillospiraceae bacterium]